MHLSTSTQLRATLVRFFANVPEVVLACLPRAALEQHAPASLRFELAPSVGEEFGHVYGVSCACEWNVAMRADVRPAQTIDPSEHFLWTRAVQQADGRWEESRLGELPF